MAARVSDPCDFGWFLGSFDLGTTLGRLCFEKRFAFGEFISLISVKETNQRKRFPRQG
jgi:hypothetical protein